VGWRRVYSEWAWTCCDDHSWTCDTMQCMTYKVLNRFAMNDIVHAAEWQLAPDNKVQYFVRYTGTDGLGTMHFHVMRRSERRGEERWNCRVPIDRDLGFATVAWRTGQGDEDALYRHYQTHEFGSLAHIDVPLAAELRLSLRKLDSDNSTVTRRSPEEPPLVPGRATRPRRARATCRRSHR
jgi:hypothetical protein